VFSPGIFWSALIVNRCVCEVQALQVNSLGVRPPEGLEPSGEVIVNKVAQMNSRLGGRPAGGPDALTPSSRLRGRKVAHKPPDGVRGAVQALSAGSPRRVTAATSISAHASPGGPLVGPRPARLERVLTRSLGSSSIPSLSDCVGGQAVSGRHAVCLAGWR
jgi:hypothetical protein